MTATVYKNHNESPSPYQQMVDRAYDVSNKNHPVREEIQRCIGTYDFTASFEEDTATIRTFFEHIPGLVAFLCTLRRGDKIIGQGRGSAVLNRMNRFIERTVHTAFNSALCDAVIRSAKVLNSFHPDTNSPLQDMGITDKQKSYLLELVQAKITDKAKLSQWKSKIDGLTKDEASESIQFFTR